MSKRIYESIKKGLEEAIQYQDVKFTESHTTHKGKLVIQVLLKDDLVGYIEHSHKQKKYKFFPIPHTGIPKPYKDFIQQYVNKMNKEYKK